MYVLCLRRFKEKLRRKTAYRATEIKMSKEGLTTNWIQVKKRISWETDMQKSPKMQHRDRDRRRG